MVLEDLGSTNGTYCNGTRVTAAGAGRRRQDPARLDDDPEVQLPRQAGRDVPAPDVRVGAARRADQGVQQALLQRAPRERVHVRAPPRHAAVAGVPRHRPLQEDQRHPRPPGGDTCWSSWRRWSIEHARDEDIFARYGGEEFAVIARGIDARGRRGAGRAPARAVEAHPFVVRGHADPVTISVGVSPAPGAGRSRRRPISSRAPTRRMYAAKRGGPQPGLRGAGLRSGTPAPVTTR